MVLKAAVALELSVQHVPLTHSSSTIQNLPFPQNDRRNVTASRDIIDMISALH